MHRRHVQHVNPFFYPKPYVFWHHCKAIGLLLPCQHFPTSLAPTRVHDGGNGGSGPFAVRKGSSHMSHRAHLPLSWGYERRWQVALGSCCLGEAVPLCSRETPDSVGQQERTSKAVLALGEIHLGAGRMEFPFLLQGLFMYFKIKQPMVLVTGIQVSPLPGECPNPKAEESCSLLPSGASGFDSPFFFFPPCCIASPEQGCKPLSRLLGRGTAHGGQDLEDFCLLRQRELWFSTPREYSLTFQLLIGKRELEFCLLLCVL